ncbi:MAG: type II toxin-antitoxin system RelE/ParE family toxin [Deltaproteobacteria bacterium]|nr:type II toxin-antitoxin system RelE/ParE family toxin [Deltaproteobacteria bacterium]
MAQIIWTEPALGDLDTIADYIALDRPSAARQLIRKIFKKVGLLGRFPNLGAVVPELRSLPYRQLFISPCRVFYKLQKGKIFIVFVMRSERRFSGEVIHKRERSFPH